MARTIRNAKIDTRSARSRLPVKKSSYWTPIAPGCALGYRKGAKGGVWVAKFVRGDIRREITIGPADAAMDADDTTALSYSQGQERARAWFTKMGREADGEV